MDPLLQEKMSLGLDVTVDEIDNLLKSIKEQLRKKKIKGFKQSYDFSESGHSIHVHIQYLEWMYGSVYRKHTYHYFLLYNFDVNESDLKNEHKSTLNNFLMNVFSDQLIKEMGEYPREFEEYPTPFGVNLKRTQKKTIIENQFWAPESLAAREDQIRKKILDDFMKLEVSSPWWVPNYVAFPDSSDPEGYSDSMGNNSNYPPFAIHDLLYWRVAPNESAKFSTLVGRASETGDDNVNDPLSQSRAESVTNYITQQVTGFTESEYDLLTEQGVGSRDPVLLLSNELEVAENRSVQFTYYQAHDYLHLSKPQNLKKQYSQVMDNIHDDLQQKVDYLEGYIDDPSGNLQVPGLSNRLIERGIMNWDRKYTLGMIAVDFAKKFTEDFNDLNDSTAIPNAPNGTNLNGILLSSPEGISVPHVLPITQLISRGSFSESGSTAFKMPLPPSDRLDYTLTTVKKIFSQINQSYVSVTGSPTVQASRFLSYYKKYIKDLPTASSFFMKKYSKKELMNQVKKNQWEFSIDFRNDNHIYADRLDDEIDLKINLSDNTFMNGGTFNSSNGFVSRLERAIAEGSVDKYYWYDADIKKYHFRMRKKIIKNILKTAVLAKQPELNNQYTGFGNLDSPFGPLGPSARFVMLPFEWITMGRGEADW